MNPYKERLRKAYSRASEDRGGHVLIARETGLTVAQLQSFSSRGTLGNDSVPLLHNWLVQEGYLKDKPVNIVRETPPAYAPTAKPSPSHRMAKQLHALAEFLEDPDIPDDKKVRHFAESIAVLFELTKAKAAQVQKGNAAHD